MLPKCTRLKQKNDFTAIYKNAQIYSSKPLRLMVLPKANSCTLVGFVVSKKVHKQANKRNRIKRLLREAYRKQHSSIKPGYLILFYAKQPCCDIKYLAICNLVKQLLSEADLYVS